MRAALPLILFFALFSHHVVQAHASDMATPGLSVSRGSCVPGFCQAIARTINFSPRGPHGVYWTHRCYETAQEAEQAAERVCARATPGYRCTARAYTASRCDR
ncbi:MAG: hypothetical protein KF802_15745 [Bdellovibrionaceae bacterium]|nr:hypothetical protein [Pseudobdellovibrionaceae bacterium]MBX3034912.1 hypothetical protein [Pseudobdellovibrionaceae bacterium]